MRKVVVDTSVIFKWFHHNDEADVEAAMSLRDALLAGALEIHAPDLLIYEFANSLRWKSSLYPQDISRSVQDLIDLDLKLHKVEDIFSCETVKMAYDFKLSIYDASFFALAASLQAGLVTADKKLYQKANRWHAVTVLSEISGSI